MICVGAQRAPEPEGPEPNSRQGRYIVKTIGYPYYPYWNTYNGCGYNGIPCYNYNGYKFGPKIVYV